MEVRIIEESSTKREIIEACDSAFMRPLASRSNKEEILSKIDNYAVFFAAYVGEIAVGYAAIYVNDDTTKTGYISMLGVVEEMQGKHIGSALLHSCIDLAMASGMTRIRLEVLKSDTRAIAFYRHWGFEHEEDCSAVSIYMTKDLC